MRKRFPLWLRLGCAVMLTGVGVFVAVSAYFAVQFTNPLNQPVKPFARELPAPTESVHFSATDGVSLAGWFVPHPEARRAVILLHGHQGTRWQMVPRARFFHTQGYAVLLYDARGHGVSGGPRTSVGWLEARDLAGAMAFLRGRGFTDIGALGMSQGGATIALAADKIPELRWAVLESTYPTLLDAVDRRFRRMFGVPGAIGGALMIPIASWRLGVSAEQIAPIDHVEKLPCPVFILHGDRDTHTFAASAEAIFARAKAPKTLWIVAGAAHVDFYGFAQEEYEKRLLAFIAASRSSAQ